MKRLTLPSLKRAARDFAAQLSVTPIPGLFGVTDGKAVGTYVGQSFHQVLKNIYSYLEDRNLPLDDIGRNLLAERILRERPLIGYLTVSNALQWRLQYGESCPPLRQAESPESKKFMARDLGDFQTPYELARDVLACLGHVGERWPRVLEPTCGKGNFISELAKLVPPPREIHGFELQESHLNKARHALASIDSPAVVEFHQANIFNLDFRRDLIWRTSGNLLVVGNPPWVTNSELGVLESGNLPRKSNIKALSGIAARTGSSNFDIAEYIWIKLIRELADQRPSIALLCKTIVARNVLEYAHSAELPISRAWLRRIDARKHFDVAVDACLFYVEVAQGAKRYEAEVFGDLKSQTPECVMGFANRRLVANFTAYEKTAFADGVCPLTWRQGVKHDAASVMELDTDGDKLRNKLGEEVVVESDYVYPLLKGSDLAREDGKERDHYVIVPQRKIGEDTRGLRFAAPKLWEYLTRHSEVFERRKSSIYDHQPPFAIFGVGDYSFAPFKVAVSGLHKTPSFRLVGEVGKRPVMFDDTSYFLPCRTLEQAGLIAAILNHELTRNFILSVIFVDAKRPVTKKLLQRIDLTSLIERVGRDELIVAAEKEMGKLTEDSYSKWPEWPESMNDFSALLSDRYFQVSPQISLFENGYNQIAPP